MRSRMNRNNSVVLAVTAMALMALCSSGNAQPDPEEWDVEWWSGETETNPYTNAAGVVWGIYEGHSLYVSPAGVTNWSTYKPMRWVSTSWQAETSDHPVYMSFRTGLDCKHGAPGALTFDPPANFKSGGRFSLYGAPVLRWAYTELWIGILDGSDNFTELHYAAVTVNNTHASDLGDVEALQNVRLREGERIAFISHKTQWDSGNRSRLQLAPTDLSGAIVGIRWDYVAPKGTVFIVK